MTGRALMLQGTGSDVGKSLLVAGLCRAAVRRGLKVLPFKPQNMSNNAAVTSDGGEIGRAQALQALACGIPPNVDMNPVLLKPESDGSAQVVVRGRVAGRLGARGYQAQKSSLYEVVVESFVRLREQADLVLVEGAGSPAELNLRANDIANMGFALPMQVPVVLVGDIDRGGVIAALVGTHALLPAKERALIAGFIINKFRGDPDLFVDGLRIIENRTHWPSFGVLPFLPAAARLPAEDAVVLERPAASGSKQLKIAVPMLSRISNFDDFDPLRAEPDVDLVFVPPGAPLPADAVVVILPGTKATIAEARFFREQGWDIDLRAHHRRGGEILGICGGLQLLGKSLHDPHGSEGAAGQAPGLGMLDLRTELSGQKILRERRGTDAVYGEPVHGFEMHVGRSRGSDCERPFITYPDGSSDGARSMDGRVSGCYLHGLFASDAFRRRWLAQRGANSSAVYTKGIQLALDEIAVALETHINVDRLLELSSRSAASSVS